MNAPLYWLAGKAFGLWLGIWLWLGGTVEIQLPRAEADELYADCIRQGWRYTAGLLLEAADSGSDTVTIRCNRALRAEWLALQAQVRQQGEQGE